VDDKAIHHDVLGSGGIAPLFLNLGDGGEWSASGLDSFTP